jgi:hypothetical protein
VSNLQVWGCAAYVYIQRDKRKSLQSHMQKCVFVGYPVGYKGWQFYNPVTKKFIISERAVFDERHFPGLSTKNPMPPFTLFPLTEPSDSETASFVPELGGDDDTPPPTQMPLPEPIAPVPADPAPIAPHPVPPMPPADHPVPQPPPAPSHSPPPQDHQPRRSGRATKPPGEWWKVPPAAPAPAPTQL